MGTSGSAASDLFAAKAKKFKLPLQIEIPQGYYGHILPRSGLARHHFIDVEGGVIDPDFRGEMNVIIIFNHSNKMYKAKAGDGIAQIVFQRCEIPNFVKCDELSKTDRGLGGFGSTGI